MIHPTTAYTSPRSPTSTLCRSVSHIRIRTTPPAFGGCQRTFDSALPITCQLQLLTETQIRADRGTPRRWKRHSCITRRW
ncbi:hypothetical protein TGRH88_063920 [Toxoplasma gondii]|uniref:Uncharacterized protein n=1 Tax=Toxoplasma gondii TaxID=5811 RepID=A0A7J6JUC2_TOXGO|nr:hypothetical protein TGRH88_063920 [Toxoplasma gondii]